MRSAGDVLARALVEREPCRILSAEETPWASVTFTGAQHRLRLAVATEDATAFVERIVEADFDLEEHLLADIVAAETGTFGDMPTILIEALTIERVDVFPARRKAKAGQDEARIGTGCGTKRAFVPLAAA